jgi:hypothetical protein
MFAFLDEIAFWGLVISLCVLASHPGFSEQLIAMMLFMSHSRVERQRANWVQQKVPHAA